jgi:hypothetical protein
LEWRTTRLTDSPDLKLASHPGSSNLILALPKERARSDEPCCLTEDDDAKPMGVEIQATGEECEQSDRSEDATVNTQAGGMVFDRVGTVMVFIGDLGSSDGIVNRNFRYAELDQESLGRCEHFPYPPN